MPARHSSGSGSSLPASPSTKTGSFAARFSKASQHALAHELAQFRSGLQQTVEVDEDERRKQARREHKLRKSMQRGRLYGINATGNLPRTKSMPKKRAGGMGFVGRSKGEGTHMSQVAQGRLKPGRPLTPSSSFMPNGLQATNPAQEKDPVFAQAGNHGCFQHDDSWKMGYNNSATNYKLAAQGVDLFEPSASSAQRVASAGDRMSTINSYPYREEVLEPQDWIANLSAMPSHSYENPNTPSQWPKAAGQGGNQGSVSMTRVRSQPSLAGPISRSGPVSAPKNMVDTSFWQSCHFDLENTQASFQCEETSPRSKSKPSWSPASTSTRTRPKTAPLHCRSQNSIPLRKAPITNNMGNRPVSPKHAMKVKNHALSINFYRQFEEKKRRDLMLKAPHTQAKAGRLPVDAKSNRAFKLGLDSTAVRKAKSSGIGSSKYTGDLVTVAGAVRNPMTSKIKHGRQCTITIPMHKMSSNEIATRIQARGKQTEKDRRRESWPQVVSLMKKDHSFKECKVPGLFEAFKRLALSQMPEEQAAVVEEELSSFAKASDNMPMDYSKDRAVKAVAALQKIVGVPQRKSLHGHPVSPVVDDRDFDTCINNIRAEISQPPRRGTKVLNVNREEFCRVSISFALGQSNVRFLNRIFSAFDPEIHDRINAILFCKVIQCIRNESKKLNFDVKPATTRKQKQE